MPKDMIVALEVYVEKGKIVGHTRGRDCDVATAIQAALVLAALHGRWAEDLAATITSVLAAEFAERGTE